MSSPSTFQRTARRASQVLAVRGATRWSQALTTHRAELLRRCPVPLLLAPTAGMLLESWPTPHLPRSRQVDRMARDAADELLRRVTSLYVVVPTQPTAPHPLVIEPALRALAEALRHYILSLYLVPPPPTPHDPGPSGSDLADLVDAWRAPLFGAVQLCAAAEATTEMADFLTEMLPTWEATPHELITLAASLGLDPITIPDPAALLSLPRSLR